MSIYVIHPNGTVLDLAECAVSTDPKASPVPEVAADRKAVKDHTFGYRTYLLAVAEGEKWEDGTNREAVVLSTGEKGSLTLVESGEPVKYYDDVHDLFVDIF